MSDPIQQTTVRPGERFADWRQLAVLLGGKVDAHLPSGKPIHSARAYNRAMRRWRMVFMPGRRRRSTNAR